MSRKRTCKKCELTKPLGEFNSHPTCKLGALWTCKKCQAKYKRQNYLSNREYILLKSKRRNMANAESLKIYKREYWKKNRDRLLPERVAYQRKNRHRAKVRNRERYLENYLQIRLLMDLRYLINRDKILADRRERLRKNPEVTKSYRVRYMARKGSDPLFLFKEQIRCTIKQAFRNRGWKKESRTFEILGCEYPTAYKYLLGTFKEAYGRLPRNRDKLHIDHIIPLATAKSQRTISRLNHYTNLRFLLAEHNLRKGKSLHFDIRDHGGLK